VRQNSFASFHTKIFLCKTDYAVFYPSLSLPQISSLSIYPSIIANQPSLNYKKVKFFPFSFLTFVDVTKSDGSKETIFWHFPSHYLETAEPPPVIDATLHPAIQAMLELKLDPLYQFIGSFTTAKRLRQYRNKPGLLEETLASKFSAVTKNFLLKFFLKQFLAFDWTFGKLITRIKAYKTKTLETI